ncbi:MAG TPA: ribonuclease H [Actinomycetota bacterium]|nr:ribonuclease H [Actinomycetota bacterium]
MAEDGRQRAGDGGSTPIPGSTTTVYTDGACVGNPGPGGWAWAVPGGRFQSGFERQSTNQRMEITAVLEAARSLDGPLDVVSDSTYVVHCFRDGWWKSWLANGWRNSQKKPVANRELWEPLVELYVARKPDIAFRWVKGHGGDPVNDLVDRLAVEAAQTQAAREGTGFPADLGAADDPAPVGRGRDPRLPSGRLVVVGGHRPPDIGGYGDNPVADRITKRLAEILTAKREVHPDLKVLTGLGLGAEQLGAEAAWRSGVPYVAVVAYPGQESVWPSVSQVSFRRLLDGASGSIVLQAKIPETRQKAGAALARRDAWLASNADEAVVVWDGHDASVGRFVQSLEDRLPDDLWILDPHDGT